MDERGRKRVTTEIMVLALVLHLVSLGGGALLYVAWEQLATDTYGAFDALKQNNLGD